MLAAIAAIATDASFVTLKAALVTFVILRGRRSAAGEAVAVKDRRIAGLSAAPVFVRKAVERAHALRAADKQAARVSVLYSLATYPPCLWFRSNLSQAARYMGRP